MKTTPLSSKQTASQYDIKTASDKPLTFTNFM